MDLGGSPDDSPTYLHTSADFGIIVLLILFYHDCFSGGGGWINSILSISFEIACDAFNFNWKTSALLHSNARSQLFPAPFFKKICCTLTGYFSTPFVLPFVTRNPALLDICIPLWWLQKHHAGDMVGNHSDTTLKALFLGLFLNNTANSAVCLDSCQQRAF